MQADSQRIRSEILAKWYREASKSGMLNSDRVSGSSPPSVFVGSYNYPKVRVGPMLPPVHGDTSILDLPERWTGKTLEEIVSMRLGMVRGIREVPAADTESRYVADLQEMAMSTRPTDADLSFRESIRPEVTVDGHSAPFGPAGRIESARFSGSSSNRQIQRAYGDTDLGARDAVIELYRAGIEISSIQRCMSIGMLGRTRRLVPTRWSITATDDMVSGWLAEEIRDHPLIDSCRVFWHHHLGNVFAVALFPRRWIYEMVEAWYSHGIPHFGSDCEDARGIRHPPAIAGAYFAAKLGILEYLSRCRIQAGAVIFREIRPDYAVPVGVWQIREGVRQAMRQEPTIAGSIGDAMRIAADKTSISRQEWLAHGSITRMLCQKTISDFL